MEHRDGAGVIDRAVHLLWVIARCDVENLSNQRCHALRELGDIELRTGKLGFYDQLIGALEKSRVKS